MPADKEASPWQTRWRLLVTPGVLRQAGLAALVVGGLLVGLNQGDVLLSGRITRQVLVRSLLTPLIPFCVTMFSAMLSSGTASHREDLRPGWAAIRRSLVIALGVGSLILFLNQGVTLFVGPHSPRLWTKILLTPCVPFCVSLYGAYVAYWHAQQHL